MRRRVEPELLTLRQAYSLLSNDKLRPLLAFFGKPEVTRKQDMVDALASIMEMPSRVRTIYDGLDDLSQKAIQEATHNPQGELHRGRFLAKYGQSAKLDLPGRSYYDSKPSELRLFIPEATMLPTDLRAILKTFVPKPTPIVVVVVEDLPTLVFPPHVRHHGRPPDPDDQIELRVRETARAALLDVKAMLRLIDAGDVKVSDKTKKPGQATMKTIAPLLFEGEFYTAGDGAEDDDDLPVDLTIKAFAWPMLIQGAGLAKSAGPKLQLTPTGRKATTKPAQEVIQQVWDKWQKTTLLDEFNRVDSIKGQQSKGSLSAIAPPMMKPRASIPAMASMGSVRYGSVNCAISALKPCASPNSVVTSRNMMPGLG